MQISIIFTYLICIRWVFTAFTSYTFNIAYNNVFYRAFRQFIKIEAPHLDTQFIDLIYIIKILYKMWLPCRHSRVFNITLIQIQKTNTKNIHTIKLDMRGNIYRYNDEIYQKTKPNQYIRKNVMIYGCWRA